LNKSINRCMKLSFRIIIVAAIVFSAGCKNRLADVTIFDLRCENLTEPAGIGTTEPGLSWKIKSTLNGTSQKAYQLLIASNPDLLNEENADLWNSGKIMSSSSILVPYGGKVLKSRSVCYWKVKIWDENDRMSEWSLAAGFSVGLLEKSDWNASYIGLPGKENSTVSPQLRKTFDIKNKGDKVFLHVNSLGYHELFLNGEKVGNNVLTPAVSQFSKRSWVITYDITGLVKEGRNDVILWLGHGWYSKGLPGVAYDRPLVRVQAEQLNNGNWEKVVSTDSTWTGRNSGYSCIGTWRSGDYGGEKIDASLLLPDLTASSLDAVSWSSVFVAEDTGCDATPQTAEMNSIREIINADTVIPFGDGKWLVDIGKTLTGWVEIKFPSLDPGQELKMEYSDHFEEDGQLKDQGQEDRYVASGKEGEYFKNKFNYHGFRYILISNLNPAPKKEDITAYLIHTDYRLASSFECSDPELNKIHNMIFYTLRCLSLGGDLVDCPQIERLGYGGDGNASTLTAQTMFDLAPLYSNWLQAWADCVRDDGGMPHTAPNPYPAGGGPYWCGFIITASWKTYVNYGDRRFLEKYYPVMQKWLGYVEKYSPGGLLEPWPETDYRGWYLGDWAVPEGTDQTDKSSVRLVNNCFISVCYETMQKIAGLLGNEAEAENYSTKKDRIRKLIQSQLFDPSRNLYGSGSQIDLTYPLLAGVVPDSLASAVRKNLLNEIVINHNSHFACGLVGLPVFTEWAVKNQEVDLMYSMLKKKDYPGYLYMLENGATTTWEHWNGARSRIHNCYNGIGSWFYQAVGGIQPDERSPGYRHFVINPQVAEGVTWANTSKETPYGTVSVKWKIEDKLFRMDMEIPVGSTASVAIPEYSKNYLINGKNIKSELPFAEVESGKYHFEWKSPK
jgi:alpha-L-rhamnosidase